MDAGAIAYIGLQVIRMILDDIDLVEGKSLTPDEVLSKWQEQGLKVDAAALRWQRARRRAQEEGD